MLECKILSVGKILFFKEFTNNYYFYPNYVSNLRIVKYISWKYNSLAIPYYHYQQKCFNDTMVFGGYQFIGNNTISNDFSGNYCKYSTI